MSDTKAQSNFEGKDRKASPEKFENVVPYIRKDVGAIIRSAREAKKLSQQELAEMLGTRQAFISDIEKGKTEPNVTLLIKLGYYLEQPVSYFIPSQYRDFMGISSIERDELSPEEEEIIRTMRDVYPVLNRGLILHLLRSLLEYDRKKLDWWETPED